MNFERYSNWDQLICTTIHNSNQVQHYLDHFIKEKGGAHIQYKIYIAALKTSNSDWNLCCI